MDEGMMTDEGSDHEVLIEDEPLVTGSRDRGVYDDYEEILQVIGFGPFQLFLSLILGATVAADAIEVLSISYIMQFLRLPSSFHISSAQSGSLSAIVFVGMLLGGYVWGVLADVIGRRNTLIYSLILNGLFAFLSIFSPNFYFLLLFRFVSGIGVGGSLPVVGPYLSEFVQAKYRGSFLAILGISWILATMSFGGVAWLILPRLSYHVGLGGVSWDVDNWRILLFLSSLPPFIASALCVVIPESPRYLLEINEKFKAHNILRLMFKWNNFWNNKLFPIKDINLNRSLYIVNHQKGVYFYLNQIFSKTLQLFHKSLVRSSVLLIIIYFTLSFGSYGIILWFPSYVDQLIKQESAPPPDPCGPLVANGILFDPLPCSCNRTSYINVTFSSPHGAIWYMRNSSVYNSTIINGHYGWVWLEGVVWDNVLIRDVIIDNLTMHNTSLEFVSFENVTIINNLTSSLSYESLSDICRDANIPIIVNYNKEYLHDMIITSAGLLGTIISSIGVYYFIRSHLLSVSLIVCTVTVFVLFYLRTEVESIVLLFVFRLSTNPAWHSLTVVSVDLYPTPLRASISGVCLMSARVGAIIGTYIFGAFSTASITLPILSTAALMFIGGILSLGLPWTSRRTALR
jgi:VNT family MFS transporter (synaptic vesicle glycoprotein 2)